MINFRTLIIASNARDKESSLHAAIVRSHTICSVQILRKCQTRNGNAKSARISPEKSSFACSKRSHDRKPSSVRWKRIKKRSRRSRLKWDENMNRNREDKRRSLGNSKQRRPKCRLSLKDREWLLTSLPLKQLRYRETRSCMISIKQIGTTTPCFSQPWLNFWARMGFYCNLDSIVWTWESEVRREKSITYLMLNVSV